MKWLLLGYGDLSEKPVAAALQQAKGSELTAVWGRGADIFQSRFVFSGRPAAISNRDIGYQRR